MVLRLFFVGWLVAITLVHSLEPRSRSAIDATFPLNFTQATTSQLSRTSLRAKDPNFVLVWITNGDVFAQIIDCNATASIPRNTFFRVNEQPARTDSSNLFPASPSVTAWSNGFVIAWHTYVDSATYPGYVRFYDFDGNPKTGAILVTTNDVPTVRADSTPLPIVFYPTIEVVCNTLIYTWTSFVCPPTCHNCQLNSYSPCLQWFVFGQRLSIPTGARQPSTAVYSIPPSPNPNLYYESPVIAPLADCQHVVAYTVQSAMNFRFDFTIWRGDATVKNTVQIAIVVPQSAAYYPSPSLATVPGTASFFLAWSNQGATYYSVASNETVTAPKALTSSIRADIYVSTQPALASTVVNNKPYILLCGTDRQSVYVQLISADASSQSAAIAVPSPAASSLLYPQIAASGVSPFYATTFTRSSLNGNSQSAMFSYGKVDSPPVLNATMPTQWAAAGAPFNVRLLSNVFSDAEDQLSISASLTSSAPLPTWMVLSACAPVDSTTTSASGLCLHGTAPPTSQALTIQLKADDGWETVTSTFGFNVAKPPMLNGSVPEQTVIVGRFLNVSLASVFVNPNSDPVALPFQFSPLCVALTSGCLSGQNISWLTWDATRLALQGTVPWSFSAAKYTVSITATIGQLGNVTSMFSVTVLPNSPPVLHTSLASQLGNGGGSSGAVVLATVGQLTVWSLQPDTFTSPYNDPLTWSATSVSGGSLPPWLYFDPSLLIFSGTPQESDVGSQRIVVSVTTPYRTSASDSFVVSVIPPQTHFLSAVVVVIVVVVAIIMLVLITVVMCRLCRMCPLGRRPPSPREGPPQRQTSAQISPTSGRQHSQELAPHTVVVYPQIPDDECGTHQPTNKPMTAEEQELQAFFEQEYPDLIDSITGEIMRDPVITSAGQSYDRTSLLRQLQYRMTDPLTNLPLDPHQPFKSNHTLKKVVDGIIAKWYEDRAKQPAATTATTEATKDHPSSASSALSPTNNNSPPNDSPPKPQPSPPLTNSSTPNPNHIAADSDCLPSAAMTSHAPSIPRTSSLSSSSKAATTQQLPPIAFHPRQSFSQPPNPPPPPPPPPPPRVTSHHSVFTAAPSAAVTTAPDVLPVPGSQPSLHPQSSSAVVRSHSHSESVRTRSSIRFENQK